MRIIFKIFYTILIVTLLTSMSPILKNEGQDIIAKRDVNELYPAISPNGDFTIYVIRDGKSNPIVLHYNKKNREIVLKSSMFENEIDEMRFSMKGVWDKESDAFSFITLSPDPEVAIFDIKKIKTIELNLHNSAELMPFLINNRDVVFVSSHNGVIDIYRWKNGQLSQLTNTGNLKFYPIYISGKLWYISYDKGETLLIAGDKLIKTEKGQLERYVISPNGRKVLLVINESQFRSDLYEYDLINDSIKLLDTDIIPETVFWFKESEVGYVKKSERDTIILRNIINNELKKFTVIKGYPIESLSISKSGILAVSVFVPDRANADVYLIELEMGE